MFIFVPAETGYVGAAAVSDLHSLLPYFLKLHHHQQCTGAPCKTIPSTSLVWSILYIFVPPETGYVEKKWKKIYDVAVFIIITIVAGN